VQKLRFTFRFGLRSGRWLALAFLMALIPASSFAGVFISVGFAPPVLPVYMQPDCPEPGLMWAPGYWAYGEDGYYWVPGAWVPAPYDGALWTPPWWAWSGGSYMFHPGYWGRHVGYYGGVNYGYGYMGVGFVGGEWRGNSFAYNTAVEHVNTRVIHDTYVNTAIVRQNTIENNNHVSFNGPHGIDHRPTPQEQVGLHEQHQAPTGIQQQHIQAAQNDRSAYARTNGGHPQTPAVARPLAVENHPAPGAVNRGSANGSDAHGNGGNNAQRQQQQHQAAPQQHQAAPQQHQAAPQQHQAEPQRQQQNTPQFRTAPERQAAPPQRSAPQQQSRPAPQQQSRPAPQQQSRPAPQQESRPAPQQESRPAPQQQSRPAPQQQSRPAPQQQSRPAPQQQSRPAPQQHEQPREGEHGHN
jgi:hypothetical protein